MMKLHAYTFTVYRYDAKDIILQSNLFKIRRDYNIVLDSAFLEDERKLTRSMWQIEINF